MKGWASLLLSTTLASAAGAQEAAQPQTQPAPAFPANHAWSPFDPASRRRPSASAWTSTC